MQQFQRIAGAVGSLLFRDGEDLVLEIFLAHVEQCLPGHGRVVFALFFRYEVEHRFHQRTLARRRCRLHHDGQGLFEQPGHRGQVADFFIGLLEQARIAQQFHRGRFLLDRHLEFFVLWCQRLFQPLALQVFQLQDQPRQVALYALFLMAEFFRCLFGKQRARTRAVQIEPVHVQAGFSSRAGARDHHVHVQHTGSRVLSEVHDAVAPLSHRHVHRLARDFDAHIADGHHGPSRERRYRQWCD